MRYIFIFCLILVIQNSIQAQESLNASGGEGSGNNGTISYSVGQLFFQSQTGTNGTVATGVQQAYIIEDIPTNVQQAGKIELRVRVYPNPAIDHLYLSISNPDDFKTGQLRYTLYNTDGHALKESAIKSTESKINMQIYKAGIYFLKISDGERKIKVFKIIKN